MNVGGAQGRRRWLPTLLACGVAAVFLLPLVWMIGSALRPTAEIFRDLAPLSIRALVPGTLTFENFAALANGPYARAVLNSLLVAGVSVAAGLLVCSMAAFALSAIDFPGRRVVFVVIVLSFLVPFESIAIPLAALVRDWGFDDSYAALIAPGIGNGLAIFLLRQFFLGIPASLGEAARIDGAGYRQIYRHVYLPLSGAPLVGAGLIIFIFQWQAYLWPLLVTSSPDLQLAPIALAKLIGQFNFDAGQMFAGALILSLIPALVLLPLQRHFTRSIAHEGVKG